MAFFWENGLISFVMLTVVIGGGAAFMSGRAVAGQWKGVKLLMFYCLLLAFAIRFLHFALFDSILLSGKLLVIDLLVMLIMGFLAFRLTRVGQMVKQYPWLYQRAGLFWWREKV